MKKAASGSASAASTAYASDSTVIRLKPLQYMHILDNNTNIARVELGPQIYARKDHELLVQPPTAMVMVPPRQYCRVANPVLRSAGGDVEYEAGGNVALKYGDAEHRFESEPFPLYPGEVLDLPVGPLQMVPDLKALRLRCIRDFGGKSAGDEYLFVGPGTYTPRIEEEVVDVVSSIIVEPNTALKLQALRRTVDQAG